MSKNIKTEKRNRLKRKIRTSISGTSVRPRFSVYRSNKFIYAQLIDDQNNQTLSSASDLKIKKGSKKERALSVGQMIAEAAKEKKINQVVFDRNGFKYTGRIRILAEEARKSGLKF